MMELNRGDIVIISFNPKKGDEVGKIRPAVIISGNDENKNLKTIIVMPLTTQLIDNTAPYRMRISKRENLKFDSDILVNHMRAISKKRVGDKIASLRENEYKDLIKSLCQNFTMFP